MDELLTVCEKACHLLHTAPLKQKVAKRLRRDPSLKGYADQIRNQLHTVTEVYTPPRTPPPPAFPLKAVAWNIERGKQLESVIETIQRNPLLKEADLFFLTEVDWGMARSGNKNVTADIGKSLGFYSYFAPSYYNFTNGHGVERYLPGKNALGLHGKAILSRTPLQNLRVISLPNATDKLTSQEARLGEKRALIGDLALNGKTLTVACAHLDAFSSPRARAKQLKEVAQACRGASHVLLAGDWNTNTMNSTSSLTLAASVLNQIFFRGPQKAIRDHHRFPERFYDLPLFEMLRSFQFDFEDCNEHGVGTIDLLSNDREMGEMVRDQYPLWLIKWINRLVEKSGGALSFKVDWFAEKNLKCLEKKVVRLKPREDFTPPHRPSDHHPIFLRFHLD